MLKKERLSFILNEVRLHNRVLLSDLSRQLNVSIDTVRRDIKALDKEKQLKKVHGGAISLGYQNYSPNGSTVYLHEHKKVIAKKAVTLLKEGSVILLSGGTTNLEFARNIPNKLKFTCFTPSVTIANQLLSKPNVELISIGGKICKDSQISVGGSAIKLLSETNFDMCFLGISSIHSKYGLSETDWEIVQLKKAMIDASTKVICPTISQKLESTQRYKVCDPKKLDYLITELDPWDEKLKEFNQQGIEIL